MAWRPRGDELNPSADVQERAALFRLFSILLVLGVLGHETLTSEWQFSLRGLAVPLSALWFLLRPRSLSRFALFACAILASFAAEMPRAVNHWVVCAFYAATLLLGLAVAAFRGRGRVDPALVWTLASPALRWITVLVYLFAGLAKLNWDFIDPRLSSAVALLGAVDRFAAGLLPTGPWVQAIAIWGTIGFELTLPLLLLWGRTRVMAILAAMSFHVVMAASGHVPFSLIAPALLFPFVPEDLPARLETALGRFPTLRRGLATAGRVLGSRPILALAATAWLAVAAVHSGGWVTSEALCRFLNGGLGLKLLYFPYAFALMLVFGLCAFEGRYRPARLRLHPLFALTPLLLMLNGLSPYLGLKTEYSFTMFSNLQTEADQWNHLFMPRWLRIFDFQDELVKIVDSDDERLHHASEVGDRLVFFEFHRYLSAHPEISVTYEYEGQRRQIQHVADDPRLAEPPTLLARKLLAFRDVARPDRNTIRH